jgi:hypothetical protein
VSASNQCLAIGSGSTANGAGAITWACDNGPEQTWVMVPEGSDGLTFEMVNLNSGKCLAIGGAQKNNGAWAIQWTCAGSAEQLWRVISP